MPGPAYTLGFAANLHNLQEQSFGNVMTAGATAIAVHYGGRIVYYVWDKAQNFWKPEKEELPSPDSSELSEQRPRQLADEFEDVTLDAPPPPPQLGQVVSQVHRVENGQQMVPVDCDDGKDNVKTDQQTHLAQLARAQAGKRATEAGRDPRGDDPWQHPKADPWF